MELKCPVCQSDNVVVDNIDSDNSEYITAQAYCIHCLSRWIAVYEYKFYDELKDGTASYALRRAVDLMTNQGEEDFKNEIESLERLLDKIEGEL